jgi:hypothetical protein
MGKDPIEAVYAFVERAYIRLQTGEVLSQCLEKEDSAPIQVLVEELVLAGPSGLDALREVLAEVGTRKNQVQEDQRQITSNMISKLESEGLSLGNSTISGLINLTLNDFRDLLEKQSIVDQQTQLKYLHLLGDSWEMLDSLRNQLRLLEEIEVYLQDWLWGLIYQSTRQEWAEALTTRQKTKWPH